MVDFETRRTMMVDTQVRPSDVTKFPIIDALLSVPRERFVPAQRRESAYADLPVDLGGGRSLLDARAFAKLLDALDPGPADNVLTIGAGLGYGAAVLSRLAGFVAALEDDATRAAAAEAELAAQGADNVAVFTGPLAEGVAAAAPYDVIIIEGGVETIPAAVLDQLKEGGRIGAFFMQGALGEARIGLKSEGRMSWRGAYNAGAPVLPGFARAKAFAL